MSASAARRIAREAVTRVRERDAFAHEVVDALIASASLDARDAAFATRLAFGTVQTRGTLDEALDRYLSKPGKVEPKVRDALAVSAYEILFARTPDRAAVSEGVELVRDVRRHAAGLANAVLRKLAADAPEFPWGDPASDTAALARLYGHPVWLTKLLVDTLGHDKAGEVLAADNEPAPLFLAENPFIGSYDDAMAALAADGADPLPCAVEGCIRAGDASAAVRGRALREGRVVVSDAAAQLVAQLPLTKQPVTVIDVGAGRGTKTLLLSAGARRRGLSTEVLALELHAFKSQILTDRMAELKVPNVRAITGDATDLASIDGLPRPGEANSVLVDAPCSGLGTLRRHPEQRWRMTPESIESLAALGRRLLDAAAFLVKPGGVVVYSTCTITREENRDVVEGFLAEHEGFALESIAADVPAEWQHWLAPDGTFQSLPTPDGPDGHFAARLIRLT